jgi:hypothetical protein
MNIHTRKCGSKKREKKFQGAHAVAGTAAAAAASSAAALAFAAAEAAAH